MKKLLAALIAASSATLAGAQTINIDVPGVKITTDATGRIKVDAPNADVRVNDRIVQKSQRTVTCRGSAVTIINGAVVNASTTGHSVQVINGMPDDLECGSSSKGMMSSKVTVDPTKSRSFVNADVEDRDFSGRDLRGADFTNATLTRVSFRRANLQGAKFNNAELVDCDLSGADLKGAELANITLTNTRIDQ